MPNASDLMAPFHASDAVGAGSAALTIKMKKEHDRMSEEAQVNGQSAPAWGPWLEQQGYGLDGKGLVYKAK